MLKVVQDQQKSPLPQQIGDRRLQGLPTALPGPQDGGHGRGDEDRIAKRCQLDQGHPVGVTLVAAQFLRHRQRQPRLADATGAGQRDEADLRAAQQGAEAGDVDFPADQPRRRQRQRREAHRRRQCGGRGDALSQLGAGRRDEGRAVGIAQPKGIGQPANRLGPRGGVQTSLQVADPTGGEAGTLGQHLLTQPGGQPVATQQLAEARRWNRRHGG